MLKLTVRVKDDYDRENKEFLIEDVEIELEHSLASLSKWEMIWEIPLLSSDEKTEEQNYSYLECMCITPNIAPEVFRKLTEKQHEEIADYLAKKNSATWFSSRPESRSGEIITSELIYYWMDSFNIDWAAENWNLNRLLTLVKVHSMKSDNKPKKQSAYQRRLEMMELSERRRKETGSNG